MESEEYYKKLGFDLFAIMMEKRKESRISKREARREAVREIKRCDPSWENVL